MSEKFQKFILSGVGVLTMSILVGYLVFAWTEPGCNPPNCNVSQPINVGSVEQIKSGTIGAYYFKVLGWDAVYGSFDTGGGVNRPFHLIGTYHGWDPYGVYIAGYNYYNNSSVSQAKKVYVGGGGTERLTIDLNTGNVGIGTTGPNEKLTIEGTLSLRELASAPGTTANYGKLYVKTDNKLYFKDDSGVETVITPQPGVPLLPASAIWQTIEGAWWDSYAYPDRCTTRVSYTMDRNGYLGTVKWYNGDNVCFGYIVVKVNGVSVNYDSKGRMSKQLVPGDVITAEECETVSVYTSCSTFAQSWVRVGFWEY